MFVQKDCLRVPHGFSKFATAKVSQIYRRSQVNACWSKKHLDVNWTGAREIGCGKFWNDFFFFMDRKALVGHFYFFFFFWFGASWVWYYCYDFWVAGASSRCTCRAHHCNGCFDLIQWPIRNMIFLGKDSCLVVPSPNNFSLYQLSWIEMVWIGIR